VGTFSWPPAGTTTTWRRHTTGSNASAKAPGSATPSRDPKYRI
jgi:hypothetical protein